MSRPESDAAWCAPPLVCLHGLAASSRWWHGVVEALGAAGPVHLLDFPRAVRPELLPGWVAGHLEEREAPVDLVGHSLGALVALKLAALRPGLVRRLILIAPPGLAPSRPTIGYGWPLLSSLASAHPRFLIRLAADAARVGPGNILRGGRYVASADASVAAGRVRAPTLVILGEHDRLVPSAAGRAWLASIPTARLHVIEGAGHVPMIESPVELVTAIREFTDER